MRPAQQTSVPMLRVPSAECVCTTTIVRADACERHAPEHFVGSLLSVLLYGCCL